MIISKVTDHRVENGKTVDAVKGQLIVTTSDRIGRSDARLVSVLTRVSRELKHIGIQSFYNGDDTYKVDRTVLKFNWADNEKVAKVVRLAGFRADIEC